MVCEVLLRTGLRVGEFIALPADAVVHIGAGHWLHVPVGKLHDDRYLPLHPHLVELIGDYRTRHVPPSNSAAAATGERQTAWTGTASPATSTKPPPHAGIGHVHPHQMRHTLATQAINRGMSLEAIAAMLGHHSLDMTLRYAKIANRTVADEYFAVTDKVEALYGQHQPLPADTLGATWPGCAATTSGMLGNGYCTRPPELDCTFEAVCENCTFFQTSIEFRPTLQAQHDDAAAKHQTTRQHLFASLLDRHRPGRVMTSRPALRTSPPDDLPAPRVDPDSADHRSNEAIDALAALRTPYWLGDTAVRLHALTSLITQANNCCPTPSHHARDQGLTWTEIGQLLNLTPATAARRYRTQQ